MPRTSNDDFIKFIAFVLTDGPTHTVQALDRALDSIHRADDEPSTCLLQYTKEREILAVAFAGGGS